METRAAQRRKALWLLAQKVSPHCLQLLRLEAAICSLQRPRKHHANHTPAATVEAVGSLLHQTLRGRPGFPTPS